LNLWYHSVVFYQRDDDSSIVHICTTILLTIFQVIFSALVEQEKGHPACKNAALNTETFTVGDVLGLE